MEDKRPRAPGSFVAGSSRASAGRRRASSPPVSPASTFNTTEHTDRSPAFSSSFPPASNPFVNGNVSKGSCKKRRRFEEGGDHMSVTRDKSEGANECKAQLNPFARSADMRKVTSAVVSRTSGNGGGGSVRHRPGVREGRANTADEAEAQMEAMRKHGVAVVPDPCPVAPVARTLSQLTSGQPRSTAIAHPMTMPPQPNGGDRFRSRKSVPSSRPSLRSQPRTELLKTSPDVSELSKESQTKLRTPAVPPESHMSAFSVPPTESVRHSPQVAPVVVCVDSHRPEPEKGTARSKPSQSGQEPDTLWELSDSTTHKPANSKRLKRLLAPQKDRSRVSSERKLSCVSTGPQSALRPPTLRPTRTLSSKPVGSNLRCNQIPKLKRNTIANDDVKEVAAAQDTVSVSRGISGTPSVAAVDLDGDADLPSAERAVERAPILQVLDKWKTHRCDLDAARRKIAHALEEGRCLLQLSHRGLTVKQLTSILREQSCPVDGLLRRCNLNNNNLEMIPSDVCKNLAALNLCALNLSRNLLRKLSGDFSLCKTLSILDLSRNTLCFIPEGVCQLSKLKVLDLSQNRLAALPSGFSKMRSLEVLIVSQNELQSVPNDIVNRDSVLTTLDVSHNKDLEILPASVINLRDLEVLQIFETTLAKKCTIRHESKTLSTPDLLKKIMAYIEEVQAREKTADTGIGKNLHHEVHSIE